MLATTYIKGQMPFPEFSYVAMLDDVRVLYSNSVFDSNVLLSISDYIQSSFVDKWIVAAKNLNKTDGKHYTRLDSKKFRLKKMIYYKLLIFCVDEISNKDLSL